ncbi:MAG TPA: HAMP domain-containing sensor histidine kinase [Planctomycetota bacterium]|nr:HAMP domain-containing sensor histidine kinase [Planctomycetota bacterium]
MSDRFPRLNNSDGWWKTSFEFFRTLGNSFTYSPRRNSYVIFGFLWGLPIPVFLLAVHIGAAGMPATFESVKLIVKTHHIYVLFLLHPILFAIVFGALGTMHAYRDARIQGLMKSLEKQNEELNASNERLSELDRLKTEFMANVTHELKSPLVTAMGYNDRMLGGHLGPVSEKQKQSLEVSKRNLTRLRNLISEIMDFSRLEAGVAMFDLVPTRLDAVAGAAVENLALKAAERKVSLITEFPTGGATVLGDPQKLLQVVVNLVDNAIKFSHEGGKIIVSIASEGKTHWKLKVADEGCGIPAEAIPKLFERFQQVDGSRARNYEGVGLGLVVVKKIIEAHGGRVWIESRVGVGTTLHVELPKCEVQAAGSSKENEAAGAHSPLAK